MRGCIFDVRGCSLMHNIKELQIKNSGSRKSIMPSHANRMLKKPSAK